MASRTRPFLMTGAALASAAAIVTASPAILPTHDLAVGTPTPLPLSTAQYALTAITDITIQGINDAYFFGWGGYVGCGTVVNKQCTYTPEDTYYPGVKNVYIAGASGVLYYLVDNAAESFVPGFDLDNYYFEIGAPSVPYVGAGELFGTDSPIFLAAQATFYYGIPNVINSIVVSATELVPEVDLGPVKVGGGILASLYFYGATPDGTFDYGTPGLSAILAYISTSISDSLPSAAALSGASTAAAAAIEGVVKNVENAINPAASSSAAAKTVSAASTEKKAAATEDKTESTETGAPSTEGSSTEGSSTEGTSTEGTSTEGSSTEGSSTEGSSTEGSSTEGSAKSTATASSAKPATTTKATKPAKPENPLAKLGKRISDALGGGKKAKSESSSSSDSSSSSSGDSSGSGSTAK